MTTGVLYYNEGTKCLVRLAVSLFTLRSVYKGPVIILSDGKGKDTCRLLAKIFDCQLKEDNYTYQYKHSIFLNATLSHLNTPFDLTVWMDADTVILQEFNKLFEVAEESEFAIAQFYNWRSDGKFIKSRIESWRSTYPNDVDNAIAFGPAINCGVFGFRKDSKFMQDWYKLASANDNVFIPDETCCQVMLHKYPHVVLGPQFNLSCMYDTITSGTRIVHYHGSKHCYLNKNNKLIYNGNLWFSRFNQIKHLPFVSDNIKYDKYLSKTLEILGE